MSLHGEGVVEVSVQLAQRHLGVGQTRAGRVVADFLSAGLARVSIAALALDAVGDVSAASGVFRRAPRDEEFSCRQLSGGGHEVPWGRRGA